MWWPLRNRLSSNNDSKSAPNYHISKEFLFQLPKSQTEKDLKIFEKETQYFVHALTKPIESSFKKLVK
jgi:hypothetical protein